MPRLLLPCDGSQNSLLALREAIAEYRRDPSVEIHVLNVQTPFPPYISSRVGSQACLEFHQEHAMEALAPAQALLDEAGVPYTVHIETGDKADHIIDAVHRLKCDRIMMATSRKSALVRAVENSLTSQLIERADVPVEVIAGAPASALERLGVPAGVGAGLTLLWVAGT